MPTRKEKDQCVYLADGKNISFISIHMPYSTYYKFYESYKHFIASGIGGCVELGAQTEQKIETGNANASESCELQIGLNIPRGDSPSIFRLFMGTYQTVANAMGFNQVDFCFK